MPFDERGPFEWPNDTMMRVVLPSVDETRLTCEDVATPAPAVRPLLVGGVE